MSDSDPTSERRHGPTPNGGVASEIFYQDAKGNPTPKSTAVRAEIHEYDAGGRSIHRTYADLTG